VQLRKYQEKKEYMRTSTLIPILVIWCVRLGLIENYKYLYKTINEIYKDTTLQIWFPDKDLEKYVYMEKASIESGYVLAPFPIKEKISDMAKIINELKEHKIMDLKNKNMPILYFISSRHFRMPILPHFIMEDLI